MSPLSKRRIWGALGAVESGPFGRNIVYYERTGSTNDIARQLARDHFPAGTLVVADEQTAGRGRLGRTWVAPPGTALLISILFRPAIAASQAYRLVMATGLAAAEACERAAGVEIGVKWPNDLQIDGLKLAGLLPESAIIGGRLGHVIVGLGLNVSQTFEPPDPLHGTATSLKLAAGRDFDRATLLAAIMGRLNAWNQQVADGGALIEAWRERCVTLGQRVRIETPHGTVEGVAEDLDDAGGLVLRDDAGAAHTVSVGEATVL
jgi:BirA family biotin operon repressor/biotin-[acetyl-CoA-carboxylase] ligase